MPCYRQVVTLCSKHTATLGLWRASSKARVLAVERGRPETPHATSGVWSHATRMRPVEDLRVHHMAWPADMQSRRGCHYAPLLAAHEP